MYCPYCGKQNEEKNKFCLACGERFPAPSPQATSLMQQGKPDKGTQRSKQSLSQPPSMKLVDDKPAKIDSFTPPSQTLSRKESDKYPIVVGSKKNANRNIWYWVILAVVLLFGSIVGISNKYVIAKAMQPKEFESWDNENIVLSHPGVPENVEIISLTNAVNLERVYKDELVINMLKYFPEENKVGLVSNFKTNPVVLSLYDLNNNTLDTTASTPLNLAFSPDMKWYKSLNNGEIYKTITNELALRISPNDKWAPSPDGKYIFILTDINALEVFDVQSQTIKSSIYIEIPQLINGYSHLIASNQYVLLELSESVTVYDSVNANQLLHIAETVNSVSFSNTGEYLQLITEKGCDVWAIAKKKQLVDDAQECLFSPNDKYLWTDQGLVNLSDENVDLRQFPDFECPAREFSFDEVYLIFNGSRCGDRYPLIAYSIETGQQIYSLNFYTDFSAPVYLLGQYLISTGDSKVWNISDGKLKTKFSYKISDENLPPILLPNSQTIIGLTDRGMLYSDIETGKLQKAIRLDKINLTSGFKTRYETQFSFEQNIIAAANNDRVTIKDLLTGTSLRSWEVKGVSLLAISADGQYITTISIRRLFPGNLYVGSQYVIEVWDLNGKLIRRWKESVKNHYGIDTFTFSPNGMHLLSANNNLYQLTVDKKPISIGYYGSPVFSANDKYLLNGFKIFSIENGQQIGRLSAGEGKVISPDHIAAISNGNNSIIITHIPDGNLITTLEYGNLGEQKFLPQAFSPDGKYLWTNTSGTANDSTKIQKWDLSTGELLVEGVLRGTRLVVSPDGNLVSDCKTIYDSVQMKRLSEQFAYNDDASFCAFTKDGKYFIVDDEVFGVLPTK